MFSWMHALGLHSMWGFSPAEDLLSSFDAENEASPAVARQQQSSEPINILLLKPCDPRHILKTTAARSGFTSSERNNFGSKRPVHFYIFESVTEVHARHLLLLQTFLDFNIPIRQRASLFLEIFGNSLVQGKTSDYIHEAGKSLTELIYNNEKSVTHPLERMLDLSKLKFREIDALAATFKTWSLSTTFDVGRLRNQRLRHYYGNRYDCRQNVVDWDYHAKVKKVASIIHSKQYHDWRETGVAYEFGCATYDVPNRSCASFLEGIIKSGKEQGVKKEVKGYWLDILVGPYIAYGVVCDDDVDAFAANLFHVVNKGTGAEQHLHHCVEVAVFNMLGMMWKIETGVVYKMTKQSDIYSGLGQLNNAMDEELNERGPKTFDNHADKPSEKTSLNEQGLCRFHDASASKTSETAVCFHETKYEREKTIMSNLSDIKIIPVGGDLKTLLAKRQHLNKFDVVFVSQQAAGELSNQQECKSVFKKGACIVVETGKYVFPLDLGKKQKVCERIEQMASSQGWSLRQDDETIGLSELGFLRYVKKNETTSEKVIKS